MGYRPQNTKCGMTEFGIQNLEHRIRNTDHRIWNTDNDIFKQGMNKPRNGMRDTDYKKFQNTDYFFENEFQNFLCFFKIK